jgi:N-sulfoglucosamine sulfohydrolase
LVDLLQPVLVKMKKDLYDWQNVTRDPWICSPHGVLEDKGTFGSSPSCMPLYNNPDA